MDLRTFEAPTMSQALAEVKSTLGPGAVILHTRKYRKSRWLGLRKREVVEITAGRGTAAAPPRRSSPPTPIPAREPIREPAAARKELLATPAAQNAAVFGLTQEINGLRSLVQELVITSRRQSGPQIPDELLEYYTQLIQNQVAEELARQIMMTLHKQIRPEHARQGDFVREKIAEQIERLLPSAGPIVRTKTTGPHVVALIGPTGVGKTTTIAKLAAQLKLREKRRVGLITIDTYRIAAVDQLRKYAEILGSPLRVVGTPEDLTAAIAALSDREFILIDTAGRSPNDAMKLNELRGFLTAAQPDEVHLVLSSTASQQSAELAVSRFADVRTDKVIFTKLDEAAHVGVVLNVVHKLNKGLSYVTTGQDVPDDIEVGRGRQLARRILGESK